MCVVTLIGVGKGIPPELKGNGFNPTSRCVFSPGLCLFVRRSLPQTVHQRVTLFLSKLLTPNDLLISILYMLFRESNQAP